ncbi:glycosyltransferase family 1 protein [Bacillus sp. AFS029637]|uniref:glycosyltransferase family 1 protein n=1 Tax=Bacillus sp. AFS029637 TaxID=2033495 RepID=UPI000BFCB431|nr:glycosyltransferase family 1 protein [Bacillus sp. AFS029637]PGZ75807.1 glycosyl transferase family 1 [Bacillus sp. AFS029637]
MGTPLRVLHVVVNMNRGGAETLIMNLYRNIDRSKVQFDFLTCKEGVFDEEVETLGGKVHRIPYVTDVGHRGYIKALDTFFNSHPQYKIVHSHMDKMSGFVLRSAKKARVPVRIAHSHNTSSEGGTGAKIYKWYAGKSIDTCATHLLACSNAAARWLFSGKADVAKILKNGIDCDRFLFCPEMRKQVREELQLEQDALVIGHVGRFAHQKNHTYLIELFAQLTQFRPNSILLLAGEGPLRMEIENQVRELNMEKHIRFLGVRADIERILQAFDAFVFPSIHEGLPLTLIEAQGVGLPCIISDAITKEVDMGMNLVEHVPLTDKKAWIEKMKNIEISNFSRKVPAQVLLEKGYDIKHTAELTQDYYAVLSR